ncbi:MAG: NfeD family protein [Planctomycetes bacterium]|nr:NfeD family protein [Planctomycetota bacterium]
MEPLAWSVLFLLLMAAAVVLEFYVPSFAMLTVAAVLCGVASVWYAFGHSTGAGLGMCAANLVAAGLAILLTMHFMQSNPLANRHEVQPRNGSAPAPPAADPRIGRIALARSDLRPSGAVELESERLTAITEGGFIEAGTPVRILRIDGARVIVEACGGDISKAGTAEA